MTMIQAGLTVATVLVVPYIVQAIKTKAMTGNVAAGRPSPSRRGAAPSRPCPEASRPNPRRG